jgi:HK97 family phage prohead protease
VSTIEDVVDIGLIAIEANGERFEYMEGRAVPFDTWSDVGLYLERHDRGSFTASLARKWKVPLLAFHDNRTMPIGIAEQWQARADGLWGRWKIAPSPIGQEAARWAREGGLGLSVGFRPVRSQWEFTGDFDPLKGPDHMDRVTRLESRLLEVSLTPTPAFVDSIVDTVEATALDGSSRSLVAEYRCWVDRHRQAPKAGVAPVLPRDAL